jgi:hypothetical protein
MLISYPWFHDYREGLVCIHTESDGRQWLSWHTEPSDVVQIDGVMLGENGLPSTLRHGQRFVYIDTPFIALREIHNQGWPRWWVLRTDFAFWQTLFLVDSIAWALSRAERHLMRCCYRHNLIATEPNMIPQWRDLRFPPVSQRAQE